MRFADYLAGIRQASCPVGVRGRRGELIDLDVRSVTLGRLGVQREKAGVLRYVAGYELESSDSRFGGLSGIDFLADGNLLASSDQGDFVWIDLGEDGITPVSAHIEGMRDGSGVLLSGKADGDAEGLAINVGLALVSFERNHRLLAFDIDACGAAARGVGISRGDTEGNLSGAFVSAGLEVTANAGSEPLAVTSDWFVFVGTETLSGGRGPLSARPMEAQAEFDLAVEDGAPAFVGLDLLEEGERVRAFSLHRGFDSLTGNAIVITETEFERTFDQSNHPARIVDEFEERARYRYRAVSSRRLAGLGAALNNVDNFEGIAVRRLDDGRVRIVIISDDNFSSRQRTLLMAFDLAE